MYHATAGESTANAQVAQMIGHNNPPEDDERAGNWFAVSREIFSHPIVGIGDRAYTDLEAWLSLLAMASYETKKAMNKGTVIMLDPGDLMAAHAYLATRWKWNVGKVRWFLNRLHTEAMITRHCAKQDGKRNSNQIQIISICNYARYQLIKDAEQQAKRQAQQQANDKPTTSQRQESNTITIKQEDRDSTREGFEISEATADEFHRVCSAWGQKPGAILFGQLTRDDTDKLLAGEVRAVAIQHPGTPSRILHAALLAAINTLTAKSLEAPSGPSKGRGTGSAASYFRQAFGSEVSRMVRADLNAEAQSRADHHVHKTNLERRINGTPRPSAGGWAAAMAATES